MNGMQSYLPKEIGGLMYAGGASEPMKLLIMNTGISDGTHY